LKFTKIKRGINMINKDYIKNIIIYLKDDRPAHAYAEMRRYMEHLGLFPETKSTKFSDFRTEFFKQLEEKTVWEKEQLKTLFDDTYFKMLNENID